MRVESAISKSDFMVFLISPQSVTKGRYTLTEMGFARSKWPNPSMRVLPVMAVPTPLENVPNYLKAVTILEPEGNMAAETRAAVDRILKETPAKSPSDGRRLTLILSIMALASAIGCYLATKFSPAMLSFSFIGSDAKAPILPGVIFGGAVATCNAIFGLRDRFQLTLVIVVTTAAWIAAFDTSATTMGLLNQYSKTVAPDNGTADTSDSSASDASSGSSATSGASPPAEGSPAEPATTTGTPPTPTTVYLGNNPVAVYVVGLVGGAVGGAITILGLLIANPPFRRLEGVMLCWATATVAGAVYGMGQNIFVLFAVWQTAVILAIAHGFSPATAEIPQWLGKLTASVSYTSRGAG
jgi:hypothetical protein